MAISRKTFNFLLEIVIRVALTVIFLRLESAVPFKRNINQDEIWLYRNPITEDYIPVRVLWLVVIFIPIGVFVVNYLLSKDKYDLVQAHLGFTLALGLNGIITDIVKLVVGRPRPDFFWRCFPDGMMNSEMECTGIAKVVMDGRKSFPSGHSSFSFAAMGFISWYIMAKLHLFDERGRGQSWRLILSNLPLVAALLIALSRTCDFHHHWQDVLVGSMLGLAISYICYRQYFPAISCKDSHRPYVPCALRRVEVDSDHQSSEREDENLVVQEKTNIKWI